MRWDATPAAEAANEGARQRKWRGRSARFSDAAAAMTTTEAVWDETENAPHLAFETDGRRTELWFENARSLQAKMRLARDLGFCGISAWVLGQEDRHSGRRWMTGASGIHSMHWPPHAGAEVEESGGAASVQVVGGQNSGGVWTASRQATKNDGLLYGATEAWTASRQATKNDGQLYGATEVWTACRQATKNDGLSYGIRGFRSVMSRMALQYSMPLPVSIGLSDISAGNSSRFFRNPFNSGP